MFVPSPEKTYVLSALCDAVRTAYYEIAPFYGRTCDIVNKSADPFNYASNADRISDDSIVNAIVSIHWPFEHPAAGPGILQISSSLVEQRKLFPFGILSEESGITNPDAQYRFIIDSLDGSHSFTQGLSGYALMIAIANRFVVEYAAVFNGVTKECYTAMHGGGVHLLSDKIQYHDDIFSMSKRMYCSSPQLLENLSIGTSSKLNGSTRSRIEHLFTDAKEITHRYALGSIGVHTCALISGKIDGMIATSGEVWDYAAPALLLRESGCIISDIDGNPWTLDSKTLVAGSLQVHQLLLSHLNK